MTFATLHGTTPTLTGIAQQPTVHPVLQQQLQHQQLQQLQQLQQQDLLPADAVSTIIDLGVRHGPAIVRRIFDLFQSQPHLMQAGLQPYGYAPWAQPAQQQLLQQQNLQQQNLLPADAVSEVVRLGVRHGPAIIRAGRRLAERLFGFQVQPQPMQLPFPGVQQNFGVQPYGMPGVQQDLLPADAVSAIIGLGAAYGPAIVRRIFDLFQSQPHLMQQGMQPYGVGLQPQIPWTQQPAWQYGTGVQQDLLPADAVSTIVDLGVRHGPAIIKRIFDLFQSQFPAQSMGVPQPAGAFV